MGKSNKVTIDGVEYRPCDIPPGASQATAGGRALQSGSAPVESPSHSAVKADWVAFAVANGLPEGEAKMLTKDELVSRFGS